MTTIPVTIADHLVGPVPDALPPGPADPFVTDDVLAEADLQKVHWDVAAGTCRLLFDLKGALFFPAANTAVIGASGVRSLTWTGEDRRPRDRWHTCMIMSSSARAVGDDLHLVLGGLGGGVLRLSAAAMEFWTGDVPGADDAPPDYVEADDATIRAGLTDWCSPFRPLSRSVRPPRA